MPFDTWISMLNKYQITVCPDNILALVAALELKEEQRANWFHMAQKLGNNLMRLKSASLSWSANRQHAWS
jgi:hypothetical protein